MLSRAKPYIKHKKINMNMGKIFILGEIINLDQFKVTVQGHSRSIHEGNDLRVMPLLF